MNNVIAEKVVGKFVNVIKILIAMLVMLFGWLFISSVVIVLADLDIDMIVEHVDLFLFTLFSVAIFNVLLTISYKYIFNFKVKGAAE